MKRLIGYFIRRTWRVKPHDGDTLYAETHRIYPTKEQAVEALTSQRYLDERFEYDVAEAWMHTEES